MILHNSGLSRVKRPHLAASHCSRSPEVTSGQAVRGGSLQSLLYALTRTRTYCKWILTGFSEECFTMQHTHHCENTASSAAVNPQRLRGSRERPSQWNLKEAPKRHVQMWKASWGLSQPEHTAHAQISITRERFPSASDRITTFPFLQKTPCLRFWYDGNSLDLQIKRHHLH